MSAPKAVLRLLAALSGLALLASACAPAASPPLEATTTPAPTASLPPAKAAPTATPKPASPIRVLPLTRLPALVSAVNKRVDPAWPQHVFYTLPEMDRVQVALDVPYAVQDGVVLHMDIYYPPNYRFKTKLPVIVNVVGFPSATAAGQANMAWQQFIDWQELYAVTGAAAVSYVPGSTPRLVVNSVLDFLVANADQLGLDAARIGVWSLSSDDGPTTPLFENSPYRDSLRAAVLLYDDLKVIPTRWPRNLSLFVVNVHDTVKPEVRDAYVNAALAHNIPVEYIVLPEAVHLFDVKQDEPFTRDTIRKTLAFISSKLLTAES